MGRAATILVIDMWQAKGLGIMNQAQMDSHVDNECKFVIYSLQ